MGAGSPMASAFILCILLGPGQGKERTEMKALGINRTDVFACWIRMWEKIMVVLMGK